MNWKKHIIEEIRADGTVYYKPYATLIEKHSWIPFLKNKTNYVVGKVMYEEIYYLTASGYGTHNFRDEKYALEVLDKAIVEKEREKGQQKIISRRIL